MSEQQSRSTTRIQAEYPHMSVCPHPEAVGERWGDPISDEREVELQGYLERWKAEASLSARFGPFDGVSLTGADVSWLMQHWGRRNDHRRLNGCILSGTHLEGAKLRLAEMFRATLVRTHLEGANLTSANLTEADLTGASFDKDTQLDGCSFDKALLDQATFLNTNLSLVEWSGVSQLGEDVKARATRFENGTRKDWADHHQEYLRAARANRRLAVALQANGLSEDATRFSYRAQVLRRKSLFWDRTIILIAFVPSWFSSLLLDLVSGYGYRPGRSFITYMLVVIGFAQAYLLLGSATGHPLQWNEAIVISMTAFHGRGFFSAVFQPGDAQAAVAAAEAFIGLLIEIVLIATFTQRFFGK